MCLKYLFLGYDMLNEQSLRYLENTPAIPARNQQSCYCIQTLSPAKTAYNLFPHMYLAGTCRSVHM